MEIGDDKSIQNIYSKYFEIIDSYFGAIKRYLGNEDESHINLGSYISRYPLISDLILDSLSDLEKDIYNYWKENSKIILNFIKNQNTLKCVYSGDITPVSLENFVKKTALYVDSIIIPDPIYNLTLIQKQIVFENKYYLNKIIRHVFNVWKLKDLVLTDLVDKIIFIFPINIQFLNQKESDVLISTGNEKFVKYINTIIKKDFSDSENILDFFEKINKPEELFKKIKYPALLPINLRETNSLNNFLKDFGNVYKKSQVIEKSIGWNFGLYIRSQFIRVQEHKAFCEKLFAEPIYDYEPPWFFYNYDIGGSGIDGAIINSLQKEKFEWISKIPLRALKILRENNELDYMRNILRNGITDLRSKKDTDLLKVSEQLELNFQEAFMKQKSEIKSLKIKVKKIIGIEMPITTGNFLLGFLPPPLNLIVSIFTTARDIKNHLLNLNKNIEEISTKKESFINLLIGSYDDE